MATFTTVSKPLAMCSSKELTYLLVLGEFISKFPLIPGHEAIGSIVEMGKNVKGFDKGDRCVADVGVTVRGCRPNCVVNTNISLVRQLFLLQTWRVLDV